MLQRRFAPRSPDDLAERHRMYGIGQQHMQAERPGRRGTRGPVVEVGSVRPDDISPVRDTTGEHADWNQPDDLWFLAGTYGGRVVRRCAIPADRRVFFPVLNMQHTRPYSKVPQSLTVAEATASLNGIPRSFPHRSGRG